MDNRTHFQRDIRRLTLQDGLSGNHIVWIRDLSDDPYDQAYPCHIPPQGSLLIHRNSSEAMHVRVVGLHPGAEAREALGFVPMVLSC